MAEETGAEPEIRFGPGIVTGLIAVAVGIIPDPAALAVVPAVISLIGALRTLISRHIRNKAPGWVGLCLGLLGLFLGTIALMDLRHQLTLSDNEPPIDTCNISPFC